MRLRDRHIVITGAGSGIGLSTAELFAREGARVAMLDQNLPAVRVAAERLSGAGAALGVHADITDESQVRGAIAEAAERLGRLDGIVNAAGVDLLRPFDGMSLAEWNRVLAVNLTGAMLICHAALPALKRAGGGTIVNISSAAGLRPLENRTAYCAAKAGLVMFSKALAIDLCSFGIRVNAICPGIIDTPMLRASYEKALDPEAALAKIKERLVMRRVGDPSDIACAALYLTSGESGFVTGVALAVDGGRTFH